MVAITEQTQLAFITVGCATEKQDSYNALVGMEEFLYGYSSQAVVEVRELI